MQGYPTLKYFSAGKVEDYNGGRGTSDFVDFSKLKAETITPPKELEEMVTNQIFDDYCRNHDGLCFISFLPDVRDSGEEKRKEYLKELKELSDTGRGANFNFLWA